MRPLLSTSLSSFAALLSGAVLFSAHAAEQSSYTMADYASVAKIDVHLHLHDPAPAFMEAARRQNFKVLTINVDYPDFPPLDDQQRVAIALKKQFPQDVAWAASFSVDGSDKPSWLPATRRRIAASMQAGAVGVKVWKNIGMSLRDRNQHLVMIDDARFAPLFEDFARQGIPLLGHQGEPHNCWLPLEKMTVNNDREYFKAHPQYHMHLHPEMPSWEAQMAARDRMVAAHPALRFIGVHLASLERDVDELAAFLDRFPTAVVDIAARIGQVQYQSQKDRERVRRFFIKYQDRILYGSDMAQAPGQDGAALGREAEEVWRMHWRYFNTAESFKVADLDKPIQGLALPRQVVDKLYRTNARRAFPGAWGGQR
ncbi:amidohydrolase [Pseudoduganella umbonata]|uniref:Amidohydrolase n=1 Tax=Pseudoduganella umbonata TaxID=864828 RepID=A0ABX5UTN2_9BURK|nr:amidohydrolase [Pseudoduganella umbonata]